MKTHIKALKIIFSIVGLMVLNSNFAYSQVDCNNNLSSYSNINCTANDITVTEFYFGDQQGNLVSPCNAGDPASVFIWTVFGGANVGGNNTRLSLLLKYDLFVNGVKVDEVELRLFGNQNIPRNVPINLTQYDWTCGDKIELKDFFMSWNTQANSWQETGPRCLKCFEGFVVNAPLVSNFNFETNCENLNVKFNNLTTGGNEAGYNFTWNFGDGNTSNQIDPIHTYASAGTYTVYNTPHLLDQKYQLLS